jgi:hypothetical protein
MHIKDASTGDKIKVITEKSLNQFPTTFIVDGLKLYLLINNSIILKNKL